MTIKDWIFPDKRKKILMHLDESQIKENEIIKAQQQKIASYETYFGQLQAREREKKHEEEQEIINQELVEQANEEAKDLKANKYGKVTSLKKFFTKYIYNKQFRNKLELCDKNGEIVLGKFGDIVLMEGGNLGILDSDNKIVSYGKTLSQVIYKSDGFENQINRNMILIPCDKDGNWTPDLDYMQMEEPLGVEGKFDDGTGKIIWGKVKKSEVKKIVARLMQENQEVTQELEMQEQNILELKQSFDDLSRRYKLLENKSHSSESNLSQVMKVHSDMEARWGDMQNRLTNSTELNLMWQQVIDKKDQIINNILNKLEEATNTTYQRVKQEIMNDLQTYKGILPSQNTEIIKPEKLEEPPVQPMQPIKK